MAVVKIHEAKTNLSKLIARVEAGEEIVIARDNKPAVKLTAIQPQKKRGSQFGAMKGEWPDIPDEFFFEPWTLEPAGKGMAEEGQNYSSERVELRKRITVDAEVCGGRPCIRGMRIRVSDVVGLLAAGEKRERILKDYPYLEPADIDAALAYAANSSSHRVIRARS
jgi:prevent-host-death family protein